MRKKMSQTPISNLVLILAMLFSSFASLRPTQIVKASHTPNPTSVTLVGDLQSEIGCAGDWDPGCAASHLAYDAGDDVWQGTWTVPLGNWQYKAALNDSWDENYGLHAVPGGDNIPLSLGADNSVKFYYDHKTHWITDNKSSVIAVAPGDFQSELGCPGDWDPSCLRSWLEDPDGDGIYSFETTALPHGSYVTKVAINESWDENYGEGGVPNGPNIPFTVPVDNTKVTFTYVAATHVLTVVVASPAGAPGGPGALSHFDLARKDCLGTARNTTSKIWYTVAGGVLSDVYAPTIDTTNVETMQYIVTDGTSFTDLQTRDMTYTVTADPTGMICTVTSTAKSGKYRLTTTYLTDPARASVVVRTHFTPLRGRASAYQLYVRLDATVGGNGGGGTGNGGADNAVIDTTTGSPVPVSYDTVTATNAANRDYAVPTYLALRADRPFSAANSGFVGQPSDGLAQLDASHKLSANDTALHGNVEQTAAVSPDKHGDVTLALGFGTTQASAVATAGATVRTSLGQLAGEYAGGWRDYDEGLRRPSGSLPGLSKSQQAAAVSEYYVSANAVKASEDKTFPGAIVASMASPWGQAVSAGDPANTYFGSYREVFSRDLYEAWTALLTDGDLATARA